MGFHFKQRGKDCLSHAPVLYRRLCFSFDIMFCILQVLFSACFSASIQAQIISTKGIKRSRISNSITILCLLKDLSFSYLLLYVSFFFSINFFPTSFCFSFLGLQLNKKERDRECERYIKREKSVRQGFISTLFCFDNEILSFLLI